MYTYSVQLFHHSKTFVYIRFLRPVDLITSLTPIFLAPSDFNFAGTSKPYVTYINQNKRENKR